MRCISPVLVRSQGRRDFVPCGKCNFCLETRRGSWTFRLEQEQKISKSAYFLTLTLDDSNLVYGADDRASLCRSDLQLFTKRLRKQNAKHTDWPVRYYSVGEYGTDLDRPHYHSIMFNVVPKVIASLDKIWPYGHVKIGTCTTASIHYVTKYVINRVGEHAGREPPFALMSRRPGIGANYLHTHTQWHRDDNRMYTQVNGNTAALPRFYKDKMFSSDERSNLRVAALIAADEAYNAEIERLAKFHPDPHAHYEERIRASHDAVTSKINDNNKF